MPGTMTPGPAGAEFAADPGAEIPIRTETAQPVEAVPQPDAQPIAGTQPEAPTQVAQEGAVDPMVAAQAALSEAANSRPVDGVMPGPDGGINQADPRAAIAAADHEGLEAHIAGASVAPGVEQGGQVGSPAVAEAPVEGLPEPITAAPPIEAAPQPEPAPVPEPAAAIAPPVETLAPAVEPGNPGPSFPNKEEVQDSQAQGQTLPEVPPTEAPVVGPEGIENNSSRLQFEELILKSYEEIDRLIDEQKVKLEAAQSEFRELLSTSNETGLERFLTSSAKFNEEMSYWDRLWKAREIIILRDYRNGQASKVTEQGPGGAGGNG